MSTTGQLERPEDLIRGNAGLDAGDDSDISVSTDDEKLFGDAGSGQTRTQESEGQGPDGQGDAAAGDGTPSQGGTGTADGAPTSPDTGPLDPYVSRARRLGYQNLDEMFESVPKLAEASQRSTREVEVLQKQVSQLLDRAMAQAPAAQQQKLDTPEKKREFLARFLTDGEAVLSETLGQTVQSALDAKLKPLQDQLREAKHDAAVYQFLGRAEANGFVPEEDAPLLDRFMRENPWVNQAPDPLQTSWEILKSRDPDYYAKRAQRPAAQQQSARVASDAKAMASASGNKGGQSVSRQAAQGKDEFDEVMGLSASIARQFG